MSDAFSRAMGLFDEVVTLPPERRTHAVAELMRTDPEAYAALVSLLASDDALHAPGEQPLLDSPPEAILAEHGWVERASKDPRIGSRLGPWRIAGVVGIGGMGTVYEAWRDDGEYTQRVALKCIRPELSSKRLVDSFRREREILAGLDHPEIATLFDGGVDDEGSPWFAMRYVEGAPIDEWCNQRQQTLRQRVSLLVHACDALAYAHLHLVLHLDIKPSNLFVTQEGQLQLLDFGLAAPLVATEHDPRIAASEGYTAPEAFSGAPPSVAMDVWSMGMVMYRLLCGTLPRTPRLLSVLRGDADPSVMETPSRLALNMDDAVARDHGFGHARLLSRQLAGDLDAIASRCIARAPEQRYASVSDLRDDLVRWLESRPVQARRGGIGYRLSRFVRRNRLATALSLAACLAITLGVGFALWHAQRAVKEAESSAALSLVFEQTVGSATLSGLGDTPMSSEAMLEQTERRVRSLSLQDHPRVLARGLSMLARSHAVMGDYVRALALADEAAALHGNDVAARTATQATRASLLNLQGSPAEAMHVARAALAAAPASIEASDRLQLMAELARSHWDLNEPDRAHGLLGEALALAQTTGDTVSEAELLTLRGRWHLQQFRFEETEVELQSAIRLAATEAPLVANEARQIAALSLQMQERVDESWSLVKLALANTRATVGEDHPLTGSAWLSMASVQCARGELDACAASIDRGETIVLAQLGDRHPQYATVLRMRSLLAVMGLRPREEGIALLRRANAILSTHYPGSQDGVRRNRMMLARRLVVNPQASYQQRQREMAEAIALLEPMLADPGRAFLPAQPVHRTTLADAYLFRNAPGDLARARQVLADNEPTLQLFPPGFSGRFYNAMLSAVVTAKEGEPGRADAMLAALAPEVRKHQGTINNRFVLREILVLRAALAQHRGDDAQAREFLARARRHVETSFAPSNSAIPMLQKQIDTFEHGGRIVSRLD